MKNLNETINIVAPAINIIADNNFAKMAEKWENDQEALSMFLYLLGTSGQYIQESKCKFINSIL